MIDLKLAEYNSEGKFVGFLELYDFFVIEEGAKFILGNNSIRIVENELFGDFCSYKKDEKDPLNRFNGLFDGITYENGRFVLIKDNDFEFYEQKFFTDFEEELGYGISLNNKISCTFKNHSKFAGKYVNSTLPKLIGNLMQNPELYEKVKNNEL